MATGDELVSALRACLSKLLSWMNKKRFIFSPIVEILSRGLADRRSCQMHLAVHAGNFSRSPEKLFPPNRRCERTKGHSGVDKLHVFYICKENAVQYLY
jgi:hypothetical protein